MFPDGTRRVVAASYPEAEFCETLPGTAGCRGVNYNNNNNYKNGNNDDSQFFLQLHGQVVCADRKVTDRGGNWGTIVDDEVVFGEGEEIVIVEYEDVI